MRQFLLSTAAVILGVSGSMAQETSPQVTPIPAPVVAAYNQADDASVAAAVRLNALINSTVKVIVQNGSGSGTAIETVDKNGTHHTLILTNNHVVEDTIKACGTNADTMAMCAAKPPEVTVSAWVTRAGKTYPVSYKAKIAAADKANDLAILLIDGDWIGDVSHFAPEDLTLYQSETIYEVGSPLGERTQITSGMISLLDTEINGQTFIAMSATTIPGNSGGGLYVKRAGEYYLVGVPTAVAMSHEQLTFTHGFAISAARVRKVLAGYGLSPL